MKPGKFLFSDRPFLFHLLIFFTLCLALNGNAAAQDNTFFTRGPLHFKADSVRFASPKMLAQGHVEMNFRGLLLRAGKIEVDNASKEVLAAEGVILLGNGFQISSDKAYFNLLTSRAVLWNAVGSASNFVVKDKVVKSEIFFWGQEVEWDGKRIKIIDGSFSTCSLHPPDYHYHVNSKEINIYPRDRLVTKKTSLFLGKKRIYTIPSMVISLKPGGGQQQQLNLIPRVGNSQLDGWSLREAVNYLINRSDNGTLFLDWFQKSGFGYGIDQNYSYKDSVTGAFHYYRLDSRMPDTSRYEFSNAIKIKIRKNMELNWFFSSNQNQYPGILSPPIYNSQFSLSHWTGRSSFFVGNSTYNAGDNTNNTLNFFHVYKWTPAFTSQLAFDTSSSKSLFSKSDRWHSLGKLIHTGRTLDAEIAYESTSGDTTSYLNREPEVTLRTHPMLLGEVPWTASVSAGKFHQEPLGLRVDKKTLHFGFLDKAWPVANGSLGFLNFRGNYDQGFFSTGESRYVLESSLGLKNHYNSHLSTRLDYNYQQPYGYSPLWIDAVVPYENITGSLELKNGSYWRLTLNSGYNIRSHSYQNLISQLNLRPRRNWDLTFTSACDLTRGQWLNVDTQLGVQLTPTVMISYWNVYDLLNKRLTYQDYCVTKDFHCWEARLSYRGLQKQFWFEAVLSAFPSESVNIGANSRSPILPNYFITR